MEQPLAWRGHAPAARSRLNVSFSLNKTEMEERESREKYVTTKNRKPVRLWRPCTGEDRHTASKARSQSSKGGEHTSWLWQHYWQGELQYNTHLEIDGQMVKRHPDNARDDDGENELRCKQ